MLQRMCNINVILVSMTVIAFYKHIANLQVAFVENAWRSICEIN